jgi:1,4-alpha-glucan branching enzyme
MTRKSKKNTSPEKPTNTPLKAILAAGTVAITAPASAPAASIPIKAGKVSLQLLEPAAKKVCVAGSFNDWKPENTPLQPAGGGRWTGELAVSPGRYEYLFVVDGKWVPDPTAKQTTPNPFGGLNSVLLVAE